jgi:thiamine biosynthesis protein ThiS
MQITVNGEKMELDAPLSVAGLLAHLNIPTAKVAVERNLEIVPKSSYESTGLAQDDRIEIVHFIGGG